MKPKIYEPVRDFERQTSYCPLYLAWQIVDEARDYFRTPTPEAFADKLAHRAEAVFAKHPGWQRRFQGRHGRETILMAMRHWLAAVLARENPALYRQLPESFKIGHPLPENARPKQKLVGLNCRSAHTPSPNAHARRSSVHGCELLPV